MTITAILLSLISTAAYAGSKSESIEATHPSVYWVPVPPELQEYAVFTGKMVKVKTDQQKIKVEYDLPEELTGLTNHIEFEGPREASPSMPLKLTGEKGNMSCPTGEDFQGCRVTYLNLELDPAVRTEILRNLSATEDELQKRESVAARFCVLSGGGEPCGFFTLYPATP